MNFEVTQNTAEQKEWAKKFASKLPNMSIHEEEMNKAFIRQANVDITDIQTDIRMFFYKHCVEKQKQLKKDNIDVGALVLLPMFAATLQLYVETMFVALHTDMSAMRPPVLQDNKDINGALDMLVAIEVMKAMEEKASHFKQQADMTLKSTAHFIGSQISAQL